MATKKLEHSNGYGWRRGSRFQADAQAVGERIERIRRRTGGAIGAADLVEDATRDRGSPLRPCFEWDNQLAATEYRMQQARYVLRSLVTVKFNGETLARPIRTVVIVGPARTVPEQVDRPYIGVEDVRENPHHRARVLANLLRAIEDIEHEFDSLVSFLELDFSPIKSRIADQLSEDGPHPH